MAAYEVGGDVRGRRMTSIWICYGFSTYKTHPSLRQRSATGNYKAQQMRQSQINGSLQTVIP